MGTEKEQGERRRARNRAWVEAHGVVMDGERVCSSCGRQRAVVEFTRDRCGVGGRDKRCGGCEAVRARAKYARRAVYYRERARARAKARGWVRQVGNAEEEAPKERARRKLRMAVRQGRVEKAAGCEDCGEWFGAAQLHGHHEDYERALEVVWLCARCHKARHRGAVDGAEAVV